jgi:hypothetical protein
MKVRSSLEAACTDASLSDGAWLATIGFLVLFDQIGTALERTDRPTQGGSSVELALEHTDRPTQGGSCVELALERFSGVQEAECAGLYALRCALAHDFSLVNLPAATPCRHSSAASSAAAQAVEVAAVRTARLWLSSTRRSGDA